VDALSQFLEWFARRRRNERYDAEMEEQDRARLARLGRTTWHDRNVRSDYSNRGLLARYAGGEFR
jgi:hypothetical protein